MIYHIKFRTTVHSFCDYLVVFLYLLSSAILASHAQTILWFLQLLALSVASKDEWIHIPWWHDWLLSLPKWNTYSYPFLLSLKLDINLSGPSLLPLDSFLTLQIFAPFLKYLKYCFLLPKFFPALECIFLVLAGFVLYNFYWLAQCRDQVYWFIDWFLSFGDSSKIDVVFATF